MKLYADASVRSSKLENHLKQAKTIPFYELEEFFTEQGRWNALAILYKNNHKYREALDIWKKLSEKEIIEEGYDGITESTELLKIVSDIELIKEFSPLIYKKSV